MRSNDIEIDFIETFDNCSGNKNSQISNYVSEKIPPIKMPFVKEDDYDK